MYRLVTRRRDRTWKVKPSWSAGRRLESGQGFIARVGSSPTPSARRFLPCRCGVGKAPAGPGRTQRGTRRVQPRDGAGHGFETRWGQRWPVGVRPAYPPRGRFSGKMRESANEYDPGDWCRPHRALEGPADRWRRPPVGNRVGLRPVWDHPPHLPLRMNALPDRPGTCPRVQRGQVRQLKPARQAELMPR